MFLWKNLFKFKGTVDVILGNPPFVAGHVQFTKIYKEPFSENWWQRYSYLSGWKLRAGELEITWYCK